MVAANPETGEVVEGEVGDFLFFRRDTWHHVYAKGDMPLRVLEFFAPPPSTGTSGAYASSRPCLETAAYTRDHLFGDLWQSPSQSSTLRVIRRPDLSWRFEGELRVGLVASTEHLTVALVEADAGAHGALMTHGGDALVFGLDGELFVRTFWEGTSTSFEIGPRDAVFVPRSGEDEILSFGRAARAVVGVAPSYRP